MPPRQLRVSIAVGFLCSLTFKTIRYQSRCTLFAAVSLSYCSILLLSPRLASLTCHLTTLPYCGTVVLRSVFPLSLAPPRIREAYSTCHCGLWLAAIPAHAGGRIPKVGMDVITVNDDISDAMNSSPNGMNHAVLHSIVV